MKNFLFLEILFSVLRRLLIFSCSIIQVKLTYFINTTVRCSCMRALYIFTNNLVEILQIFINNIKFSLF